MNYAFREAVVSVLASRPGDARLVLGRLTAGDWARNDFWFDASGLALYFLHALRQRDLADAVPAAVRRRLCAKASDNQRRTEVLFSEFLRVNAALTAAGVRFAAMKGFTLFPDYCFDPALRLQLDFDYLVGREQMPAVTGAVRALGYELVSDLPFEVRFATNPGAVRRHAELYMPPVSHTLEFHFALFDRPELGLRLPRDPLENARAAQVLGESVSVLAPEDQFLHQILHAFQDVFLFSMRLSALLEIARGIRSQRDTPQFWNCVRRRTDGCDTRVPIIAGLVLALAEEIFRCELPSVLRAWTVEDCPPPMLLWIGEYGRRWALQAFPGNKLSLLVTRELMDRRSWRAYAWSSVLPVAGRWSRTRGRPGHAAKRHDLGYKLRRAKFHIGEALRLFAEWPRWRWKMARMMLD